jgi:hypothetical protein
MTSGAPRIGTRHIHQCHEYPSCLQTGTHLCACGATQGYGLEDEWTTTEVTDPRPNEMSRLLREKGWATDSDPPELWGRLPMLGWWYRSDVSSGARMTIGEAWIEYRKRYL